MPAAIFKMMDGHSKNRGCTRPGCTVPGYWCQVHHVDDWAEENGPTDIDNFTLACGPDNRLVEDGDWKTRKRKDGRIEWIPPPHLDSGQSRVNDYHHPEKYFVDPDDAASLTGVNDGRAGVGWMPRKQMNSKQGAGWLWVPLIIGLIIGRHRGSDDRSMVVVDRRSARRGGVRLGELRENALVLRDFAFDLVKPGAGRHV